LVFTSEVGPAAAAKRRRQAALPAELENTLTPLPDPPSSHFTRSCSSAEVEAEALARRALRVLTHPLMGEDEQPPVCGFSLELLSFLIQNGEFNKKGLELGLKTDDADIERDLVGYGEEAYKTMCADQGRVAWFKQAIDSIDEQDWLEVGPGEFGPLTKMVLSHDNRNPRAAAGVRKRLKGFGSRLTVQEGFGGQVCIGEHTEQRFQAIVGEVLGNWASAEGWIGILRAMARRDPWLRESVRAIVPRYFGTCFVPVDLTRAENKLKVNGMHCPAWYFERRSADPPRDTVP
jgi:hypothetical protein